MLIILAFKNYVWYDWLFIFYISIMYIRRLSKN